MIDREDMLELTRRMTPDRTHFVRLAGAYMDEEGYVDGNFNTHFLKLTGSEKVHCIQIAKAVPYAKANEELHDYALPKGAMGAGSLWQLLYALIDCELKNDALLMNFYEILGETLPVGAPYAIYLYYGVYDVPIKAADKERLESEEVYKYLICAICDVDEEQTATEVKSGFLWPAFRGRSTDLRYANVYEKEVTTAQALKGVLKLS